MWTKPSGLLCHWQCFYIVVTRHAWWKVNMTSNIYCTSTNSLTIWTFCFQTFLWPQQRWGSREALPALKPSRRERCLHTTGNFYITIKTFPSIVSWWHITYFRGSCSPHLWVSFFLLRGMIDREKFQLRAVKILSKFQDFQDKILVHSIVPMTSHLRLQWVRVRKMHARAPWGWSQVQVTVSFICWENQFTGYQFNESTIYKKHDI